MVELRRFSTRAVDFAKTFAAMRAHVEHHDLAVEGAVREILARVREEGDAALVELTGRYDHFQVDSMVDLEVTAEELAQAAEQIDSETKKALVGAAERIRAYHELQREQSWQYRDELGSVLGQQIRPLGRAGIYVPGGKAAYPSSVLMNAIPAKVAEVGEIIMTVPTPAGERNALVMHAAQVAGVDRVFAIGGAQAVAALAYGTETVPRVDKIVGPGNRYVAAAKRLVFGQVGIDMIAGPSEVVILADGSAPVSWVAMDLCAQAEHDQAARAFLICPDPDYVDAVVAELDRVLPSLERREIIRTALGRNGALIEVEDLEEGVALVNELAPEHLGLALADPESWLPRVQHAGAIFLGHWSSEVLGDYCAGPNHVLPTAGTARFSSPLGVYDFQKRSSVVHCSPQGAKVLGHIATELAQGEGFTAHARSAALRVNAAPVDPSTDSSPNAPSPNAKDALLDSPWDFDDDPDGALG